jgi:hypothetical protein
MLLVVIVMILSFNTYAVSAQEPNVGILRVYSFQAPREVAPSSIFSVNLDVEYGLHGRPDNATIRAAIYRGDANYSEPLWQSNPEIVRGGGDKTWSINLTSPSTEGYLNLIAYAFFLDQGAWKFYNNSLNGPGFSQVTIRIGKTATLDVELGTSGVPVSIGTMMVKTSSNGDARMMLLVGSTYAISVAPAVDFQNSTRVVFNGWNDGTNQTQRSVLLDGDVNLVGSYKVQYLLRVSSPVSSYSEWHDAGSVVKLQTPSSLPMNWPLGFLGLKHNFIDWTGDVNSPLLQINITMNAPKTLKANFSADYSPLVVPAIIAAGIAGGVVLSLTRHRRRASDEHATTEESTLHCGTCGEDVEMGWTHCTRCGADLADSESSVKKNV